MGTRTVQANEGVAIYITPAGKDQAYVTASVSETGAGPAAASSAAYRQIAGIVGELEMQIVHERIFGSLGAHNAICQARAEVMGQDVAGKGQATYIEGHPCWGEGLAGISIQAIGGGKAAQVRQILNGDGAAAGCAWKRNGAEFLMLQNVHALEPDGQDNTPEVQAGRMFDEAEELLRAHGATYRDVVRTWIYLPDILSWYDRFNAARNERYHQFGIMPDLTGKVGEQPICLPASTGIEGDNPMGAACVMDVLAITGPAETRPDVEQMTNIKQEDAFMYGSAFSRGAYLGERDVASILISGTAAIDEKGHTLHPNDVRGQILRTFDNVETLIGEKGAALKDICEANVFLQRAEDIDILRRLASERGLEGIPAVCVNADICRDDLLFEMDGVALIPS